jgi:TonB family protein
MKFIKPEKRRHKLVSAIYLSLLMHASIGSLLVFGSSNNLIFPPSLNGLNLVWVSLDTKSKNSGMEIQKGRFEQRSLATEKNEEKKFEANASKTLAAEELINPITLARYDIYGTAAAKEQSMIGTAYGANQTASDTSNLGIITAYPLYRENIPPAYPEIARIRGYEGIVMVIAEILPDGHIGNMKIRKSSGYTILDQSAIKAIKPWRFEPAKKSGKPFTIWVELPIKFILHDDNS